MRRIDPLIRNVARRCAELPTARRAVASDEQESTAHTSLTIHELFQGQHDNAIRRLQRAIELDPNSTFAR